MMQMQTSIFEEREKWSGAVMLSAGLHLFLVIAIIVVGLVHTNSGVDWGESTTGEAINANIVSAVPLPAPQEPTKNIVATENKGITQSVPKETKEEPDAVPIPDKQIKHKPEKTPVTPAVTKPPQPVTPPKDNVVPYGEGGPISGPYGSFTAAHTKGGFSFQGGGDFGSRFAYYVQAVNQKVTNNWYTVEVSPSAAGHRVYLVFDIERDGTPSNVRVEQTSGIPALDQSAVRAVQRIDTFGHLPDGYSGSKVSVEFWFDYQR
jgi:protein TonB